MEIVLTQPQKLTFMAFLISALGMQPISIKENKSRNNVELHSTEQTTNMWFTGFTEKTLSQSHQPNIVSFFPMCWTDCYINVHSGWHYFAKSGGKNSISRIGVHSTPIHLSDDKQEPKFFTSANQKKKKTLHANTEHPGRHFLHVR